MPTVDTARLLLFSDDPRAAKASADAKVRRYRLARLPVDAARRAAGEPRYAYLKRGYD